VTAYFVYLHFAEGNFVELFFFFALASENMYRLVVIHFFYNFTEQNSKM
jgi:hypothetical protein